MAVNRVCDRCHRAYDATATGVHRCPYTEYGHYLNYDDPTQQPGYQSLGQKEIAPIRKFETGATRDTEDGKLAYSQFFSVEVLERRAQFMHKHRIQPDGRLRDGGNWKKGIPRSAYLASLYRHFIDVWKECNGVKTEDGLEQAICAAMFNLEGMLYELLKENKNEK